MADGTQTVQRPDTRPATAPIEPLGTEAAAAAVARLGLDPQALGLPAGLDGGHRAVLELCLAVHYAAHGRRGDAKARAEAGLKALRWAPQELYAHVEPRLRAVLDS